MPLQRIALWGAGSLDNLGDRLIARITATELRSRMPRAQVEPFCPWSEQDNLRRLYFDAKGRWPYEDSFDAVVVSGGGVFAGPPFKDPVMQLFCFGCRPADFAPNLFTAWNAVGLQDDTLPADKPACVGYLGQLGTRIDYCSVRAIDAAERLHIPAGDWPAVVVPDPVYALKPLPDRRHIAGKRARIGVALGNPFHSQQFLSRLSRPELANSCPFDSSVCLNPLDVWRSIQLPEQELQRQLTILPAVTAVLKQFARAVDIEFFGFGAMYGDQELATELAAQVPKSTCQRLPDASDCDAAQSLIASYDLILASRYHAAILAHRACRPFIAIDPHWSHRTQTSKLAQLMDSIHRGRFYWRGDSDEQRASASLACMIDTALAEAAHNHGIPYAALHQKCIGHFDRLAAVLLENAGVAPRASFRDPGMQPAY